jgi:hypothetical protein
VSSDGIESGDDGVPDTRQRRRSGIVYLTAAAGAAAAVAAGLPSGMWAAVVVLMVLGIYHLVAAPRLVIDEATAREAADGSVQFPVGHASARVGFEGWRARPVWNLEVISADDPPTRRALVRVDGTDGRVIGSHEETIIPGP